MEDIKKYTIKEASASLSKVLKNVDLEGIGAITRYGVVSYLLLPANQNGLEKSLVLIQKAMSEKNEDSIPENFKDMYIASGTLVNAMINTFVKQNKKETV